MSGRHYMLVCKTVLISVRHRNIQLKKSNNLPRFFIKLQSNFLSISISVCVCWGGAYHVYKIKTWCISQFKSQIFPRGVNHHCKGHLVSYLSRWLTAIDQYWPCDSFNIHICAAGTLPLTAVVLEHFSCVSH